MQDSLEPAPFLLPQSRLDKSAAAMASPIAESPKPFDREGALSFGGLIKWETYVPLLDPEDVRSIRRFCKEEQTAMVELLATDEVCVGRAGGGMRDGGRRAQDLKRVLSSCWFERGVRRPCRGKGLDRRLFRCQS